MTIRIIILSGSSTSFCSGVDLMATEDVFKGDIKDVDTDPVSQMEVPISGSDSIKWLDISSPHRGCSCRAAAKPETPTILSPSWRPDAKGAVIEATPAVTVAHGGKGASVPGGSGSTGGTGVRDALPVRPCGN